MPVTDLKGRLANNEVTFGSWITLGHPAVAEIMSSAGFDWLVVDMEHSAITLAEAQGLIRTIELSGPVPLVRVGANDPTAIKRVMDAGAHGVVVPMVNSAEDARRAVAAVKYPPVGTRGVGLARAQGYGMDFASYRDRVNEMSVVVVQIEHVDAVEALESILEVDGVDACIVGPYDLSASMGKPGEFDAPDVTAAVDRVVAVATEMGMPAGFHVIPPDAGQAAAKLAAGYKFIALSLDTLYLGTTCSRVLSEVRAR